MASHEQIQWRMQFDVATKNALRERGDDETRERAIEHHFVADDRAALASLIKTGRLLGFEAGDVQQGQGEFGQPNWYVDLLSESPTYLSTLSRESLLMLTLSEAYGVSYDGWGTLVVKSGEASARLE